MTNTQQLSKRSKRLLEEASRHLDYAAKGLNSLSIDEYRSLAATCFSGGNPLNIVVQLRNLTDLQQAICRHLAEREQL